MSEVNPKLRVYSYTPIVVRSIDPVEEPDWWNDERAKKTVFTKMILIYQNPLFISQNVKIPSVLLISD